MTRLLLLSDRPLFARTVARVLETIAPAADTLHRAPADAHEALEDPTLGHVLIDLGTADDVSATRTLADILAVTALPVACVLDAQRDTLVQALMDAGAAGVMIKTATPQALVTGLELLLAGELSRPAPQQTLDIDALPPALRGRLNGREQKLLRLAMGGTPVPDIARRLGMTEAKVVHEARRLSDLVRGREGGD